MGDLLDFERELHDRTYPIRVTPAEHFYERLAEQIAAEIASRMAGLCPDCGMVFWRLDQLYGHTAKHSRERKKKGRRPKEEPWLDDLLTDYL